MKVFCKRTYKVNKDLHLHLSKKMKKRFTFFKGNYYKVFSENKAGYFIFLTELAVIGFYKTEYAENNTNIFENVFYTEKEVRKIKLSKIKNNS